MQIPRKEDAKHKAWLYRILSAFYNDTFLTQNLFFKGGTCAAMLGYLDRFSVDLDFDLAGDKKTLSKTRAHMEVIFRDLGLEIKDSSKRTPQYFLRYVAREGERNTLKIDVTFPPVRENQYEKKRFTEIDRIIPCQTRETMFANKLVALIERHEHRSSIAARDVYDIHHFFENSFDYRHEVIEERTGQSVEVFLKKLIAFIDKQVTNEIIAQDLNTLVSYEKFRVIRKTLKQETIMFLKDELTRTSNT